MIDRPTNRKTNWSINHPTDGWTNQPTTDQWTDRLMDREFKSTIFGDRRSNFVLSSEDVVFLSCEKSKNWFRWFDSTSTGKLFLDAIRCDILNTWLRYYFSFFKFSHVSTFVLVTDFQKFNSELIRMLLGRILLHSKRHS